MKPATSSRPCIESAASWSAAIHPSVRPSRAATSLRRQRQPHHLVEVRRGLVGREAQVGGADLDELAARPQPGQRQRRVGAAGDHQVQLRGQVLQQEGHPVLDVARVDDVVVVEHQHDVVREGAEVVEQRGEDRFDRRAGATAGARARPRRPRAPPSAARRSGRSRTARDRCRRWSSESHAADRPSAGGGGQPLGQQRRLAEAGRCRDQRQLRLGPASRRSLSRGRGTRPRRGLGT